jgi:single-strand DNA-binding protein
MLNRVILIGRIVKDPDLRYSPAGVGICQFSLAVDRPFSTGNSKEKEADFINIVTWRQLAETCANYLKKGRLTAVEGRLQVRNYDNNEGRKVYVTEVIADNVRFLEGNSGSGSSGNRSSQGNSNQSNGRDPLENEGVPLNMSNDGYFNNN